MKAIVTMKDTSIQADESKLKILLPTSVNKSVNYTDNRSTMSEPTSAGSTGVVAPKPAVSTTTKPVAANLPTRVERNPRLLRREINNSEDATRCK